jgi:hypothetical protein
LRRCVPGALEGDLARPNNLLPYPFFLACTLPVFHPRQR